MATNPAAIAAFLDAVSNQLAGVGVTQATTNPTTTPVAFSFPSGLLSFTADFLGLATPSALYVAIVFDPLSADDAATKLGDLNACYYIGINAGPRTWTFSPDSPVYSIYVASDAATESGSTLLALSGKTAL